jgi:hypothetical protein
LIRRRKHGTSDTPKRAGTRTGEMNEHHVVKVHKSCNLHSLGHSSFEKKLMPPSAYFLFPQPLSIVPTKASIEK